MKIDRKADQKTIKAAYHTLMFKFRCHPDLGGQTETALLINEAYETLSDPATRDEYDKKLFEPVSNGLDDNGLEDRRRIHRVTVSFTVYYKSNKKDFSSSKIVDLSYLGCRLQTAELLSPGEKVTIDINGHVVDGTVKWKRMFHPNVFQRVYESGIEFNRDFDELDMVAA